MILQFLLKKKNLHKRRKRRERRRKDLKKLLKINRSIKKKNLIMKLMILQMFKLNFNKMMMTIVS